MTDTPTNEPAELRAGDTWKWRREDLTDYPATAWTLTYRFVNASTGFEVIAGADGTAHLVDVAPGTTAGKPAGAFDWAARVSNGTAAHTVDRGRITVLPNLFAGTTVAAQDLRTHARKALEAIEAVLEGRATLDQEEYTIGGRSLKRTPVRDLLFLRSRYRAEVKNEEAAEKLRNGLATGRTIRVRL